MKACEFKRSQTSQAELHCCQLQSTNRTVAIELQGVRLVLLQLEELVGDAARSNCKDLHCITCVHVALACSDEGLLAQLDGLRDGEALLLVCRGKEQREQREWV